MVVSLIQEKINNILLKCQVLLETSQTTIHELGSLIETLQSTEEADWKSRKVIETGSNNWKVCRET